MINVFNRAIGRLGKEEHAIAYVKRWLSALRGVWGFILCIDANGLDKTINTLILGMLMKALLIYCIIHQLFPVKTRLMSPSDGLITDCSENIPKPCRLYRTSTFLCMLGSL